MVSSGLVYLDESGDLGWKLHLPYLNGGSSRYFVVAMAVGINQGYRRFGKIVDTLHRHQGWTSANEKKWTTIGQQACLHFCQLAARELATNADTKVIVSVCNKATAPDFIQDPPDPKGRFHLIYAMMVAEALSIHMPNLDNLSYCPDELNEGEGMRTLDHLLAFRLLYHGGRNTRLKRAKYQAPMQGGLAFADMIAGSVWEARERGDSTYLDVIAPHITITNIF